VSHDARAGSSELWGLWFSAASSTLLPAHRHDCVELNLIMSGHLAYRLEDRETLLEAGTGQLVAIPRGVDHELVRASEDLTLWVLELKGAGPLGWASRSHALAPTETSRRSLLLPLRKLWLRPPNGEALVLQDRIWRALLALEETLAPDSLPVHPAVAQAKSVCEQLAHRQLDIERLALESGLSASRLAHLFAEQLGITPLQYRNFARVQYFIRSYDGDERNLLRAALRAGFGSYAQFHRTFRQVCGEAPAAHFKWLTESARVDAKRTLGSAAHVRS
jgi:AraC-like DNA-binding protein